MNSAASGAKSGNVNLGKSVACVHAGAAIETAAQKVKTLE